MPSPFDLKRPSAAPAGTAADPASKAGAASAVVRVGIDATPQLPIEVAARVLDGVGSADASGATLIVPDLRVAPALRRAFGIEAARRGYALCLPPRIVTTYDALREALPDYSVEPAARRAERLYGMVRAHGWYQRESLWDTCAAVIALADELGEAHASVPAEGDWRRAIRAAYKRGVEQADSQEARLVWEVWHAETAGGTSVATQALPGETLTPTVFGIMALEALCTKGFGPWFVLTHAPLPKRWLACLERYAVREPVTLIELVAPAWTRSVWGTADATAPAAVSASLPKIRILAANSLEAEAGAVEATVCAWLAQGINNIALIGLDTLVARRARALLERRQVLLSDEAGWRLSTTSAATAVMRWVEALVGGMPSRTVLDWLKSPFVLGDLAPGERASATAAIEDAVHRHDITRFTPAMLHAAELPAEAIALIQRLLAVQGAGPRGEASFGKWVIALDAALDQLGMRTLLGDDAAGAEVLALIAQLLASLAPEPARPGRSAKRAGQAPLRASLGEWRIFLAAQFEQASFRDQRIDSPVVLTSLEAAQLRPFDAVLLVGAGAAHLGTAAPDDLFVNTTLRSALGLTSAAAQQDQLHHRLACLIGMAGTVAATWRKRQLDEAQPLAAALAQLELARRLRGDTSGITLVEYQPSPLPEAGLIAGPAPAASPASAAYVSKPITGTTVPAPRAAGGLPARISVSAYANLLACPYRFFATAILGLREPDELEDELSKRDYGIWVHRVLTRFHETHALLLDLDDDKLLNTLEGLADEVFAPLIAFNYLSLGWKLRLAKLFPSYIAWQREREQQGWRFDEGEAVRVMALSVGNDNAAPREIDLVGRIDRVDRHIGQAGVALIDYKTQRLDDLKRRLRDVGEEAQLAVYAMFEGARGNPILAAGLASIDGDAVALAPAQIDEPAERVRAQSVLRAIEGGAALPANGVERVCALCHARGLCRKDYWNAVA